MSKQLTKAEEQVMQVLWKLGKGFLKDIVEEMPEPKPHNNTVATMLKILVDKGFAGIKVYGRMHEYHPLLTMEQYKKGSIRSLVKGYFEGSFSNAVSFMVKENNLSVEELELLVKELKKSK